VISVFSSMFYWFYWWQHLIFLVVFCFVELIILDYFKLYVMLLFAVFTYLAVHLLVASMCLFDSEFITTWRAAEQEWHEVDVVLLCDAAWPSWRHCCEWGASWSTTRQTVSHSSLTVTVTHRIIIIIIITLVLLLLLLYRSWQHAEGHLS